MKRRASPWLSMILSLLLSAPAAAAPAPVPFDDKAFAQAQSEGRTIVVETYAYWCLPCRIQAPILDRLRSQAAYKDVVIYRIGEKSPERVWKRFRLNGFGNLIVFRGIREVARGTPTNENAVADLLRRAR
ncbi:thioredoxin family protein [Sphingomonas sp.]|uniref:TlpA family protein disulfide reductase n=1 Tax=Sphingomonas sp. TaxID=28214 RepID=UPI00307FA238